ncbi:MAG TPA: hypothetical protein VF160_14015 [Candidatus Dormibacteraeota bacterium]
MSKTLAVSRYSLLELWRRRIVLVVVLVAVALVAGTGVVPHAVPGFRTDTDRTIFILDTLSRLVGLAASLCAYAVGMTIINHDLESGTAVALFAKPVSRVGYALGKLVTAAGLLLAIAALLGGGTILLVALNGGGHVQVVFWFAAATAANTVLLLVLLMILSVYINNIVAAVIVLAFNYVDGVVVTGHTLVQENLITSAPLQWIVDFFYWALPHPLYSDLQRDVVRLQLGTAGPHVTQAMKQQTIERTIAASSASDVVFWLGYLAVLCALLVLAVRRKQV